MFYGLASGNVDTGGLVVDQVLADIEILNRAAFDGKYEVTAVSFHAYAHLADTYALLPHGASMGDNYGPIVVARDAATGVKGRKIAIPGTLTTAYLTLRLYDPNRPIYDKARYYTDVSASYKMRLFDGKVRCKLQLNVN